MLVCDTRAEAGHNGGLRAIRPNFDRLSFYQGRFLVTKISSPQAEASPDTNSATAINIVHRRTPTLQLQSTSCIAGHQLCNCNQHRASPDTNSATAINIAHRRTPTQQLQSQHLFKCYRRCAVGYKQGHCIGDSRTRSNYHNFGEIKKS
jgi:hypothetical protein